MAEEYDYRAVYLKSKYLYCYANVTRAGSPRRQGLPRPASASAGPNRADRADQAISYDISK